MCSCQVAANNVHFYNLMMIYTAVNPHADGDGPRPEDAHAAPLPPRTPHQQRRPARGDECPVTTLPLHPRAAAKMSPARNP
jgi:hypothetical protein